MASTLFTHGINPSDYETVMNGSPYLDYIVFSIPTEANMIST